MRDRASSPCQRFHDYSIQTNKFDNQKTLDTSPLSSYSDCCTSSNTHSLSSVATSNVNSLQVQSSGSEYSSESLPSSINSNLSNSRSGDNSLRSIVHPQDSFPSHVNNLENSLISSFPSTSPSNLFTCGNTDTQSTFTSRKNVASTSTSPLFKSRNFPYKSTSFSDSSSVSAFQQVLSSSKAQQPFRKQEDSYKNKSFENKNNNSFYLNIDNNNNTNNSNNNSKGKNKKQFSCNPTTISTSKLSFLHNSMSSNSDCNNNNDNDKNNKMTNSSPINQELNDTNTKFSKPSTKSSTSTSIKPSSPQSTVSSSTTDTLSRTSSSTSSLTWTSNSSGSSLPGLSALTESPPKNNLNASLRASDQELRSIHKRGDGRDDNNADPKDVLSISSTKGNITNDDENDKEQKDNQNMDNNNNNNKTNNEIDNRNLPSTKSSDHLNTSLPSASSLNSLLDSIRSSDSLDSLEIRLPSISNSNSASSTQDTSSSSLPSSTLPSQFTNTNTNTNTTSSISGSHFSDFSPSSSNIRRFDSQRLSSFYNNNNNNLNNNNNNNNTSNYSNQQKQYQFNIANNNTTNMTNMGTLVWKHRISRNDRFNLVNKMYHKCGGSFAQQQIPLNLLGVCVSAENRVFERSQSQREYLKNVMSVVLNLRHEVMLAVCSSPRPSSASSVYSSTPSPPSYS